MINQDIINTIQRFVGRRAVSDIIIHCSATKEYQQFKADDIKKWHLQRGFNDIGYHFVILLDGTIELGRPLIKAGAHCAGYNSKSIGICYIGGLDSFGNPKDTRTNEQKESMRELLIALKKYIPTIKTIKGHRDYSTDLNGDGVITKNEYMKDCPCFDVMKEYENI